MSSPIRVSPQQANEKVADGWSYLDVRSIPEFEAGHPAGAFNAPLMHAETGGLVENGDFVRVILASFPRDARIIVGCKSGGRSVRAAQTLLAAGYSNVLEQRAGWDGARDAFGQVTEPGWSRAGLPSETGKPEGRSWDDLKRNAP
ncbi:MAG: rhodanese-like domain-containing protein [Myxococcota bacterium]|nr:rhodanese-like domain-containing protein [Myxococcota bacterium]